MIRPDRRQHQEPAFWITGEQAEVPRQFRPLVPKKALPDKMKGKGVGGQRIAGDHVLSQTGFEAGSVLESEGAEGGLRHERYRAGG